MRRLVPFLVAALIACNPSSDRASSEAAEEGSSGAADDELAFDNDAEPEAEGEAAPQGEVDAKAEVTASVAATRATMDAERLLLDQRKAEVDAALKELETRLSTISALRKRLDERLGEGETARKRRAERISVLAKLIMSMPPQAGASMVGQMTDEDAKALVLQMSQENERKASKLLSAMPGDRAAELGQLYLDEDPAAVKPGAPAKEEDTDEDPAPLGG